MFLVVYQSVALGQTSDPALEEELEVVISV